MTLQRLNPCDPATTVPPAQGGPRSRLTRISLPKMDKEFTSPTVAVTSRPKLTYLFGQRFATNVVTYGVTFMYLKVG